MARIRRRFDPNTGLWWCPRCERFKPRDCFAGPDPAKPRHYCRTCKSITDTLWKKSRVMTGEIKTKHCVAQRAWRSRNKEAHAAAQKRYRQTPMGRLTSQRSNSRSLAKQAKTDAERAKHLNNAAWCDAAIARLKRAAEIEVPTCERRRS